MTDNVPLICDPVPTRFGGIIAIPDEISEEQIAELKALWVDACERGSFVMLEERADISIFYPKREEWPDAEFCAA